MRAAVSTPATSPSPTSMSTTSASPTDAHGEDQPARLRLLIVSAASVSGRSGRHLTSWVLDQLRGRDDVEVAARSVADVLDDRDAWAAVVKESDAVLLITPEHNHSFPGDLKTAIDLLRFEWTATPVGVVSYGGVSGGLRATEALRLVFAELHTLVVRDTVSVANVATAFDDNGRPHDADGLSLALGQLLRSLGWWSRTLAAGLDREPYPA